MKTPTAKRTSCRPPAPFPENSMLPELGLIFQELTFRGQQKWGLPPNVCMVLGHLRIFPDVCEPAAIAEAKRLPRQTMTFVLDTLEKMSLAVRKPHPSDRRRKMVHLTAKGKRLADNILQDFLQLEKIAMTAMGSTSLKAMREILENFGESISGQNTHDFRMAKG